MNKNMSIDFFLTRSIFSLVGINVLFKLCGQSIIPSIIMGSILGIIVLRFIRFSNKLKLILSTVLLPTVIIFYSFFIKYTMANNINIFLIILSIIFLVFYLGKNKESDIRNFSLLCFFITSLVGILIIVGEIPNIQLKYYPININYNFIIGSFIYMFITTIPILLCNDNYNPIPSYLCGSITNLVTTLFCIFSLGYSICISNNYPNFLILKDISYLNIISRIDVFLEIIYLFDGLILLIVMSNNVYKLFTNTSIAKTSEFCN